MLVDFTKDEAKMKSMQQKVAQSMPMKAKKAISMTANSSISVSSGALIDAVILDEDGEPPNNEAGCISSLMTPD